MSGNSCVRAHPFVQAVPLPRSAAGGGGGGVPVTSYLEPGPDAAAEPSLLTGSERPAVMRQRSELM